MQHPQRRTVLWPVGRVIGLSRVSDLTDGQLLECLATGQQEAAFEALLQRHGPMVLGVCRRVLKHAQDSEDAFQATFLLLLRKAGTLAKPESVGSWLYGAAYRIAANARARARRRRAHERQMVVMHNREPRDEPVWQTVEPIIDEEVNRLPEKYRQPVVLCYLQGKAYAEAARQLGCPKGTIAVRLTRARALLRRRLARRGIVVSASLLALFLFQNLRSVTVSRALRRATLRAVWFHAVGSKAVRAGGRAVSLAVTSREASRWSVLKASTLGLVLSVLLGSAGLIIHQALGERQVSPPPPGVGGDRKPEFRKDELRKNMPIVRGRKSA